MKSVVLLNLSPANNEQKLIMTLFFYTFLQGTSILHEILINISMLAF